MRLIGWRLATLGCRRSELGLKKYHCRAWECRRTLRFSTGRVRGNRQGGWTLIRTKIMRIFSAEVSFHIFCEILQFTINQQVPMMRRPERDENNGRLLPVSDITGGYPSLVRKSFVAEADKRAATSPFFREAEMVDEMGGISLVRKNGAFLDFAAGKWRVGLMLQKRTPFREMG